MPTGLQVIVGMMAQLVTPCYPKILVFEPCRIRVGKNSGQPTKRHLSRRRFQKALGVAPVREDSGDKKSRKLGGSSLCRMALWRWLFTRIEPHRCRVKSDVGLYLGDLLDHEKKHKPVKLARSRVCSKAAELLFKELVKELLGS